jgi:hypothetical protein
VTRNRNLAVRVPSSWPRNTWPTDAAGRLQAAIGTEPHPRAKEQMVKVLNGEPFDG